MAEREETWLTLTELIKRSSVSKATITKARGEYPAEWERLCQRRGARALYAWEAFRDAPLLTGRSLDDLLAKKVKNQELRQKVRARIEAGSSNVHLSIGCGRFS
ncbi:MAG: hypothetical protein JW751_19555 [Polyangiaceae bacterium]|nr:hypothetical protein [Polyangiaceae bacterium]